jgi:hypothetical protein
MKIINTSANPSLHNPEQMDNENQAIRIVNSKNWLLADAHVHVHDNFDWDTLLTAAANNFTNALSSGQLINVGVLFIADILQQKKFSRLKETLSTGSSHSEWVIQPTLERISVIAKHPHYPHIILIAARQIVTSEKMEVLSLFTGETFTDNLTIYETLGVIAQANGLPVFPWGVGKWIGRRGTILNQLLQNSHCPLFFLGDNSGRPIFWPRPSYFQDAEARGIGILPGTDPLPLPSEIYRPGSFGFRVQADVNRDWPGMHLKQLLLANYLAIEPYGVLESPLRFIRNQLLIRAPKSHIQ